MGDVWPCQYTLFLMLREENLENPMGERRRKALQVDFDRSVKLEFHGATVTSDAGLLAYRELDEALGLTFARSVHEAA